MEIMFQNIVGGIMIDSFSELKEEDESRNEDKNNFCYICSMDRAAVLPLLPRWNDPAPPSSSTPVNATSSGTTSTTSIVSDSKAPLTSQDSNTRSTRKSMRRMSSGSLPWAKAIQRARLRKSSVIYKLKSRTSSDISHRP